MKKFPNKKIANAYERAKDKAFTKISTDLTYKDQYGNTDYDHVALNWLEHNGILDSNINKQKWVFEYRLVKQLVDVYVFGGAGNVMIKAAEDAGYDSQCANFTMTAEEATAMKNFLIKQGY